MEHLAILQFTCVGSAERIQTEYSNCNGVEERVYLTVTLEFESRSGDGIAWGMTKL